MRAARVLALAVIVTGCSGANGSSGHTSAVMACEAPPGEALEETSAVGMTVDPNPVAARQTAELVVDGAGFTDEATVSVDARWQCWDGSDWVTTHVVYRGLGDDRGETIPVNPDFQIQVPDIALWLDRGYSIATPDVEAGTYRIADEVDAGNETVSGFVFVEVTGG